MEMLGKNIMTVPYALIDKGVSGEAVNLNEHGSLDLPTKEITHGFYYWELT